MDQGKAARRVYDAIIDQELEAARLLDAQVTRLDVSADRLKTLARAVYRARVAGRLTKREARLTFTDGFALTMLLEFAYDAETVRDIADAGLQAQLKAVKALDVPIHTLKPIRDADIKARVSQRANTELSEQAERFELGIGRGRLPSMAKLKKYSPERLEATLQRFGIAPDQKAFDKAARRAYETQLEAAIEERGFPDRDTWAAIDDQLRRAAVGILRQQTKRAIHRYRIARLREEDVDRFIWIAVSAGSCPSCESRHGKVKTLRQWESAGLPGSAVLVCKKECRCSLQPDYVGAAGDTDRATVAEANEGLEGVDGVE